MPFLKSAANWPLFSTVLSFDDLDKVGKKIACFDKNLLLLPIVGRRVQARFYFSVTRSLHFLSRASRNQANFVLKRMKPSQKRRFFSILNKFPIMKILSLISKIRNCYLILFLSDLEISLKIELKAIFLKNYLAKPYGTKNLQTSALPIADFCFDFS